MNKIKRSGKLLQAAFAVLFREKKLLLFPFVTFVLVLAMALFFLAPIVLYPTGHSIFTAEHWTALGQKAGHWFNIESYHPKQHITAKDAAVPNGGATAQLLAGHPWTATTMALIYFISMFLATFFNVAFYHEIMQALNGNAVFIRRGFRFAASRWKAVLLWSLFAGLVGYLIQELQQRLGMIGRLVTGLIGSVWSVACIFIIPTLVRDTETANPLEHLRNSVGTLKKTWGELIIGFVGLEAAFGAVFMTALLLVATVAGVSIYYLNSSFHGATIWIIVAGIAVLLLLGVVLSCISSIVNPVYRCALYIYATEGVVPGTFDKELLDSAWKVK